MKQRAPMKQNTPNQRGASALAYGLIAALIAVATIGATNAISDDTSKSAKKPLPEHNPG